MAERRRLPAAVNHRRAAERRQARERRECVERRAAQERRVSPRSARVARERV